jgi:hypothetical protein
MKFLETKTIKGIIYINIESITTLEIENEYYTRVGISDGTHIYVGDNIETILEKITNQKTQI